MSVINLIGLDVGEKRIGVAKADNSVCLAFPITTIEVNGSEVESIKQLVESNEASVIVVGYPRNQSGQPTKQTQFVEEFAKKLINLSAEIVFQDESLTSVIAEDRLKTHARPYKKGDIDAQAATIILQDYIEAKYESRK